MQSRQFATNELKGLQTMGELTAFEFYDEESDQPNFYRNIVSMWSARPLKHWGLDFMDTTLVSTAGKQYGIQLKHILYGDYGLRPEARYTPTLLAYVEHELAFLHPVAPLQLRALDPRPRSLAVLDKFIAAPDSQHRNYVSVTFNPEIHAGYPSVVDMLNRLRSSGRITGITIHRYRVLGPTLLDMHLLLPASTPGGAG